MELFITPTRSVFDVSIGSTDVHLLLPGWGSLPMYPQLSTGTTPAVCIREHGCAIDMEPALAGLLFSTWLRDAGIEI
ncbi:MAG: hypothetical protein R2764_00400 [Bacteroidales bacterium]